MKRSTVILWPVGGSYPIRCEMTEPYRQDGIVEWGSLTKLVTSMILRKTAEKSLISLDDDVAKHLSIDLPVSITVGHLLRHESGLSRNHQGMKSGLFSDPYQDTTINGKSSSLSQLLVQDEEWVGKYRYSNIGFALIGRILEAIYAEPFQDILFREISTRYNLKSITTQPNMQQAILLQGFSGKYRTPWDLSNSIYVSAGGTWSTVEDILRFLSIYISTYDVQDDTNWIISTQGYYLCSGALRDSTVVAAYDRETSMVSLAHCLAHTMGYTTRLAIENLAPDAENR